jgi:hypothetical protein
VGEKIWIFLISPVPQAKPSLFVSARSAAGTAAAFGVLKQSQLNAKYAARKGQMDMKIKEMLEWREVIGRNMPEQPKITEEIRQHTIKQSARFRGSVRLSTGTFWTDEEYQRRRTEVLNTPLP